MKLTLFNKTKNKKTSLAAPKQDTAPRPYHDWNVMISIFAALVILIFGLNIYLFWLINRGDFFTVSNPVGISQISVNGKTLLDANKFFESRQKEYSDFSAGSAPETDPSI